MNNLFYILILFSFTLVACDEDVVEPECDHEEVVDTICVCEADTESTRLMGYWYRDLPYSDDFQVVWFTDSTVTNQMYNKSAGDSLMTSVTYSIDSCNYDGVLGTIYITDIENPSNTIYVQYSYMSDSFVNIHFHNDPVSTQEQRFLKLEGLEF